MKELTCPNFKTRPLRLGSESVERIIEEVVEYEIEDGDLIVRDTEIVKNNVLKDAQLFCLDCDHDIDEEDICGLVSGEAGN